MNIESCTRSFTRKHKQIMSSWVLVYRFCYGPLGNYSGTGQSCNKTLQNMSGNKPYFFFFFPRKLTKSQTIRKNTEHQPKHTSFQSRVWYITCLSLHTFHNCSSVTCKPNRPKAKEVKLGPQINILVGKYVLVSPDVVCSYAVTSF